jgi:hypothetical protein
LLVKHSPRPTSHHEAVLLTFALHIGKGKISKEGNN